MGQAFWTGVRLPSSPPKRIIGGVLGWGCTGFDRASEGEQATRKATNVIRAKPQTPTMSVLQWPPKANAEAA